MSSWSSDDICNPSSLDEMAIYPEAKRLLDYFFASGDIPHIIFHGDVGTGKTTAATLLAQRIKPDFTINNVFDCGGNITNKEMDAWKVQLVGSKGGLSQFFSDPPPECFIFDEFHGVHKKIQTDLNIALENAARNSPCFFCVNDLDSVAPPIKDRCTIIPFDVAAMHPKKDELVMFSHHSWSASDWKEELRRVGRIATKKKGFDINESLEDKVLAKNLCCVSTRTYIRKLGQEYDMDKFYAKVSSDE